MRVVLWSLAIVLFGLAAQAQAQCVARPGVVYGGVSGYSPYNAYYAPYAGYPYAGYTAAPFTPTYAPFRARQPAYPVYSNSTPVATYGRQTTYFRGQPGPLAPPGGTFFGGYDYQVTYPPDWYGGYWTWW